MNWNDLPVFLAVADAGTLAGAARRLGVNHSTAFRRLAALEERMGTRLFDRLPSGYALTPGGERMLAHARVAESAVAAIDIEVAGQDIAPAGRVVLTTAPNLARTLVPPAMARLRRTFPEIEVEVAVGDTDYNLNRHEADIALRATTRPPEHLVGRKVMDLQWWFVTARCELHKPPASVDELSSQPLIGADSTLMRLDAFQFLETHFRDQIVARANDLVTMAAMAAAGVGVALVPSDVQDPGLQWLFPAPDLRGELWLLTHPDLRHVRRVKAVWDALVESVDQSSAGPG